MGLGREVYVHTGTGTGNGIGGLLPWLGAAGIVRVDLDTAQVTPYARGLAMSNGVVRASNGTFYASERPEKGFSATSLYVTTHGGSIMNSRA